MAALLLLPFIRIVSIENAKNDKGQCWDMKILAKTHISQQGSKLCKHVVRKGSKAKKESDSNPQLMF